MNGIDIYFIIDTRKKKQKICTESVIVRWMGGGGGHSHHPQVCAGISIFALGLVLSADIQV